MSSFLKILKCMSLSSHSVPPLSLFFCLSLFFSVCVSLSVGLCPHGSMYALSEAKGRHWLGPLELGRELLKSSICG